MIADKLDKMRCEAYWRNYGVRKHSPTVIRVLYPQEYANSDTVRCDATIVVGWLNSKNMKNVIYCYGSSEYTILTYACEEKWRIAHTRLWNKSLSNSSNHRLVRNSFSKNLTRLYLTKDLLKKYRSLVKPHLTNWAISKLSFSIIPIDSMGFLLTARIRSWMLIQ